MLIHNRNWSLNPFKTHRTTIALSFGILTLLLALLLSLIASNISHQQIEKDINYQVSQMAQLLAVNLDHSMYERYQDVQVLANIIESQQESFIPNTMRDALEQLQSLHPDYSWIGMTDADGIVIASTAQLLEGNDVSSRPWFINGQDEPYLGDVHPAVLLQPLVAPNSDEPLRLVDIAMPIHSDAGEFVGVLGVHVDWHWAQATYDLLLTTFRGNHNIELYIVTSDNEIVLAPETNPAFDSFDILGDIDLSASDSFTIESTDGQAYLFGVADTVGYQEYEGLGWRVITNIPTSVAFAPAHELRSTILLVGGILGCIFVVIGWGLASWVTRPIEHIVDAARAIREGDTATNIPQFNHNEEVTSLGETLQSMVTNLRDEISERERTAKNLSESESKLRTMLEHAAQGIVLVDKSGNILLVNNYIERAFGHNRADLLGNKVDMLLPPQFRGHHHTLRDSYMSQPEQRPMGVGRDLEAIRSDGTTFPVEVSLTPIPINDEVCIMAFVVDITERKNYEEQRIYAAQLELELEKERELGEVKDRFVSFISHEFRTPLTIILSSITTVSKYMDRLPREQTVEKLQNASKQINRMTELMEDALSFSRTRSGKVTLELEEIDVKSFIEGITSTIKLIDENKHSIQVLCDIGKLYADIKLLDHVISNLVSNAVKYSPPQTEVTIKASKDEGAWHFIIQDAGIGIPEEDLNQLFEPFYRASNVGDKKGTGLGLSIVKEYVTLHGGQITVDSEIDKGSVFEVVIPDNQVSR